MQRTHRTSRGFTIVELMIVVAIIGLLMALLMPALSSAMRNARATHDRGVIGGLGKALTNSAADFQDQLLRPSLVARCDYVRRGNNYGYMRGKGLEGKPWDSTENLYSALIMMDYIVPEACISPVDTNPLAGVKGQVEEHTGAIEPYAYGDFDPGDPNTRTQDEPTGFWDTRFYTQLEDDKADHASYANQTLVGRRHGRWKTVTTQIFPLLATRGTTTSGTSDNWSTELTSQGTVNASDAGHLNSRMLEQIGPENVWQGHAYTNDGKVVQLDNYLKFKHYAGMESTGGYIGPMPDDMYRCEFTEEWTPDYASNTEGHGAADNFLAFSNNNNGEQTWNGTNKFCFAQGNGAAPDGWRYFTDSIFLPRRVTFDYVE